VNKKIILKLSELTPPKKDETLRAHWSFDKDFSNSSVLGNASMEALRMVLKFPMGHSSLSEQGDNSSTSPGVFSMITRPVIRFLVGFSPISFLHLEVRIANSFLKRLPRGSRLQKRLTISPLNLAQQLRLKILRFGSTPKHYARAVHRRLQSPKHRGHFNRVT
jgi:hypothetical protein